MTTPELEPYEVLVGAWDVEMSHPTQVDSVGSGDDALRMRFLRR
jgi:hypothetical protein